MADFRRWLYAFALVALIAGLTVPASAQSGNFICGVQANPAQVRAQGYTELVGDVLITCNGGTPTRLGQSVPQASITVSLNTFLTSKLTTTSGGWTEALLIIDEPNSSANPTIPLTNCGLTGNDSGQSGPSVCSIISDGNPADTYKGLSGYQGCNSTNANPCVFGNTVSGNYSTTGEVQACTGSSYGCGFPNVFQARQGTAQVSGQPNSVVWSNVPIDPPGSNVTRYIRITNIRSDAESLGIATNLVFPTVTMSLNVQPSTVLPIGAASVQVATVYNGITVTAPHQRLDFAQCNDENAALYCINATCPPGKKALSAIPYFGQSSGGGLGANPYGGTGGGAANSIRTQDNGDYVNSTPAIRFAEGFNTAFKARNISALSNMGVASLGGGWVYNGNIFFNGDQNQNVPATAYATEDGFVYNTNFNNPGPPNPPAGLSSTPVTGAPSGGGFVDSSTGIAVAGVSTQGTRLIATFNNIPQGANIYVPTVSYLYRQNDSAFGGSTPADPTKYFGGHSTGVIVLVQTDAAGYSNILATPGSDGQGQPLYQVPVTSGTGYVTYEVLFDDPGSQEQVDVPVVVAYAAQLTANGNIGLPVPSSVSGNATATGGFAPYYTSIDGTSANARLPQTTNVWPIPRFTPPATTVTLFEISKCACNLLFPYVTNSFGYDTGIAIANTSQDPGGGVPNTNDFGAAQPQSGTVTIWYYGQGANNTAAPGSQTSSIIPPGQLLLYALSSGGSGLDGRGQGFEGYIIAQAQFEYCHGFAFIEALGGGPTNPATGYLGIVLDAPALPRTNSPGENDGH